MAKVDTTFREVPQSLGLNRQRRGDAGQHARLLDGDDILRSFALPAEDSKKYGTVKAKFDAYFVKERNVIYERARFNQRKQEDGEPVDTFITALHGLCEHCGYGELHDEMIRDRIVVGIRNSELSVKLQMDSTLTLNKAVAVVRRSEMVNQQQSLMRGGGMKPDTPVGRVQQRPSRGSGTYISKKGNSAFQSRQSTGEKCGRCGKPSHPVQKCPARNAVCHKCAKRGHFRSMCRSTAKVAEVHEDTQQEGTAFLGKLSEEDTGPCSPWSVTLLVNGIPVQFDIDTGADVTVISTETHRRIGSPKLYTPQQALRGPSNHELVVKGQFTGKVCRGKKEVQQKLFVVEKLHRQLLGRPAIEALNLIARVKSISTEKVAVQFPNLFKGLGKLGGEYTIQLREGVRPFTLSVPRRVAIPLTKQVEKELNRMEKLGVIAKVTEPTEWCAGMVVVPKGNGEIRICVDLTRLNECVCRERHPLPAVEQTLAQLAGARVFSKLDANSGFWQIPLSLESALLTTFITPFGRYCFHRLPFGITSAPEHFQRRMSELLTDLEGVICMMDDILVYGRTSEEHDKRLTKVLHKLESASLTLNREKCQFSKTQVKFLGQVIDQAGIRPDPDKVAAIQNVPTPTTVGDVRRFLGMANHLSKFSPNLANKTKPLRELLIKSNQWTWGEPQEKAFQDIKDALVSGTVLALYDPNRETIVSADASSYGVGAVLLQKQSDGQPKPIAYISRALTTTEQRYAQIEKEALAFTWACERFSDFLMGKSFHIFTDHKPLVPLFSSKKLDELPIRVQRFRLRMMRFSFTISHVPGESLLIADTLSRAPARMAESTDTMELETGAYVKTVVDSLPTTERQLERIKQHQMEDEVCQQVVAYCQSGWPSRQELLGPVKLYYSVAEQLSVVDGLLMRGSRIVIPASLRIEMLDKIHTGHQGIAKCRERARQSVWWPGLSKQLDELVKCCAECCRLQNQRAEPLIPSALPTYPWQKVGTDLFEWRKESYLLIVDYYSRYIEVAKLKRTTAEEVIIHTKSIYARHGIPEIVVSDNGPQYSSEEYRKFAHAYQFEHVTSSPLYPRSNGEAERAVQTIKSLLKKEGDPYLALLSYRATPLQSGFSPSELLMSRKLRTTLPITREQLTPKVPSPCIVQEKDKSCKVRQQINYDRYHAVKELPPLNPGDTVWIPDRQQEGTITQESGTRSFQVETPEGTYRRNRRALIQMPEVPAQQTDLTELSAPPESVQPRRSNRQSRPPERLDNSWN